MRCAQVDRQVELFLDGRLELALARRIEAHIGSCASCRARVDAARGLLNTLDAVPIRAPAGFVARVMDEVYRQALSVRRWPGQESPDWRPPGAPARIYRRLGLSFVLTAAVLAASLFVPGAAYPQLLKTEVAAAGSFGESLGTPGASDTARGLLNGADSIVRGILREQANGRSVR